MGRVAASGRPSRLFAGAVLTTDFGFVYTMAGRNKRGTRCAVHAPDVLTVGFQSVG